MSLERSVGATYLGEGRCRFCVWAPRAEQLSLHVLSPSDRMIPLERTGRGYFLATVERVKPGTRYLYRIDGEKERPDPASRYQPLGVHGPSEVVDPGYAWEDSAYRGATLQEYVIYEIHVGTFTHEGTFEAIIPVLDDLRTLGITALELMPVVQFPGRRNWGYDGVNPFAVQNSYGGPPGLKRLVNASHLAGLAVILDVAYNHLGPEGNYLAEFAPYFTDRYKTPWGAAVNFDGADSMEVRRFFIENALYWITEFHIDALRLDAIHAIYDFSARPFLEELTAQVHDRAESLNCRAYLIAESDRNDPRILRPPSLGGLGLDAQWNDDFHHALHVLLTGEKHGYYEDFGEFGHLVKACREGFVYAGEYSRYRRRQHGNSSRDLPASRFVVFAQNHDQIGNRMLGERLSGLVSFETLKLAAGAVLLSPFIPLLFMGEEYGETAPFQYFISHQDPELVDAVRKGRREEFADFRWQGEPPDPQSDSTFQGCKLNRALSQQGANRILHDLYKELIALRRSHPSIALLCKEQMEILALEKEKVLVLRRWAVGDETVAILAFGSAATTTALPLAPGRWKKLLDSAASLWDGPGSQIPEECSSSGEVLTPLNATSVVVLAKCT